MHLSPDERAMYVLTREPKALVRIALERFTVDWKLPLFRRSSRFRHLRRTEKPRPSAPDESVRLVDLATRIMGDPH